MTYDFKIELDLLKADARWEALKRKGAVVELIERKTRTPRQNNYLHLIIGAVAMETGNTIEYTKEKYFKRMVNPDLFIRWKDDRLLGKTEYLRHSSELTKEEMTQAIDKFRNWAATEGWYLPSPDDKTLLQSVEYQMGKQRQFL